MFEAAGFRFRADTYQPGGEGCCFLHVRPGPAGSKGRGWRAHPTIREGPGAHTQKILAAAASAG
jgi:hypothetical protein